MDREAFLKEYEAYNLDDLNTIYVDQADRFTPEERDLIFELIQKKEHPIVPEPEKSYLWLYLLSFLFFPIGILAGIILAVKRNKTLEKVSVRCSLCASLGLIAFVVFFSIVH